MTILRLPLAALAWLGRQGTRAVAAIVFIAIALPPLDAVLKPFVSEAIFVLLAIAFMRVDTTALRRYLRQPWLVLATTGWTMLVVP
ncbi:MAG TPA: Na+-dependent transporter, partial [Methylomirabilota bacterium]|nr:Na+-dependent transporter [Methylomirabilota bacterium]